ncbi:DUF3343 domain-containing protein [Campylobacter sp. MG1]|uniref:DUF3343 domain-containing protein n=1 Tax=Campylobacter sp. MG1 TaxID=2976332 RepID=UPI00226C95BC|nr:DUF3343 domain-containing protein [Campylobacter sp. MG1]
MKLLTVFATTSDVLLAEKVGANLGGEVVALPEELEAGCGMAYLVEIESIEKLKDFFILHNIRFENIYQIKNDNILLN